MPTFYFRERKALAVIRTSVQRMLARPFVFFAVILFFKSCLAWLVLFDGHFRLDPLVTEVPFLLAVFCLIELFASKRKLQYYLLANLLFTGLFFAVIMYYKYYGVIVTYHALHQVNQVTAVKNSVFSLMDPQYLLIFLDIVLLGGFLLHRRNRPLVAAINATRESRRVLISIFAACFALCLANIFPNRASMNEFIKAEQMGILNYEAYTLFADEELELADPDIITQETIDELKGIKRKNIPNYWGVAEGRNVIVIQLESFQNFLIDLKVDGQEITPVMNELVREHFYFNHFFQQVGQGNTSDAEFVVNTSFYIPPRGAASDVYADKALPSMPKLFKGLDYETVTFHTNVVEFWNRGEMYAALGFDRYYDQAFFGDEDTVFFGPSDEVLYRKTAEELRRIRDEGKRFYAHVISMTAHHPFTIPEEKDRIVLPDRYKGNFVGDYLRSQNYADYCLGLFVEQLKESGIWDNSVIVIYGDHVGLPIYSLNREEKELMAEIYGREYTYTDMINVPLVIIAPGITQHEVFHQVGGQVDVLPTIANLVGISLDDYLHFGQDLLNHTHNLLPQRYYLPTGSYVSNAALFMPGSGFEDGVAYSLSGLGVSTATEATSEDEYTRALELLRLSDSYLNQLPLREP